MAQLGTVIKGTNRDLLDIIRDDPPPPRSPPDDVDAPEEPVDVPTDDGDTPDDVPSPDVGDMPPPDFPGLALQILAAILSEVETGLVDGGEALEAALTEQVTQDIQDEEQIWRPYRPDLDEVQFPDQGSTALETAVKLRNSVRMEATYLRNQLRSKFLQARAPRVVHGVRKGIALSDRRLVSSAVELRAGKTPTHPDWQRGPRDECSLAAALVLDESGSMSGVRTEVAKAAIAMAEPLDTLGSPCLVIGPRTGRGPGEEVDFSSLAGEDGTLLFHRVCGVIIDVFKNWDEPFNRVLGRFANVRAASYTPLEDGIQYALQELSERPERHRVVLVVTDGDPDNPAVCRRQIRLAAEAGIHIIGIGIGINGSMVTTLFPEHVYVPSVNKLPEELLKVLTNIVFPKAGGKRVQLDGQINRRISTRSNST